MRAYVGLGSNLGEPMEQISSALHAIDQLAGSRLIASSSLYRTPPMGPQDQPDYLNAAAEIETSSEPLQLLQQLQYIEQQQGRVRKRHWGERTIDLDLLLYGEQQINLPTLQVPHPGLIERAFVLVPLMELAGELLWVAGQGELGKWLVRCDCSETIKVEK